VRGRERRPRIDVPVRAIPMAQTKKKIARIETSSRKARIKALTPSVLRFGPGLALARPRSLLAF